MSTVSKKAVLSIRPSASLIVLRRLAASNGQDFEVLMAKQRPAGSFGSFHVFPGGLVDPVDQSVHGHHQMEFKIAAVRETFEESGYLVPPHASFEPLESLDNPAKRFEWRQRIHESPAHFKNIIGSAILQSESSPPYQNLLPWAHWITPFFERVRFSTLFFLHLVPETESLERLERKMSPDGSETVSLEWIKPSLAIAAFEKESRIQLMPPQFVILKELERLRLSHIEDLLAGRTKRESPVPICPERVSGPVEAPDGSIYVVMRLDGCEMFPYLSMHRTKDGRLIRIVQCQKPLT